MATNDTYAWLKTLEGPTKDEVEALADYESELMADWYEFEDES